MTAAEKREAIRLVEESDLSVHRTRARVAGSVDFTVAA